jgi:integrase/recombinase XerD
MSDPLDDLVAEFRTWLTVERGLAPNSIARTAATSPLRRLPRGAGSTIPAACRSATSSRTPTCANAPTTTARRYAPASIARAVVAVRVRAPVRARRGHRRPRPHRGAHAAPRAAGDPEGAHRARGHRAARAVTGDEPRRPARPRRLETLYAGGCASPSSSGSTGRSRPRRRPRAGVRQGPQGADRADRRVARAALDEYLRRGRPELEGRAVAPTRRPVFLNVRGGRLSRQACWRIVRDAGVRAGLGDGLSPHVLRALVRHPHARPRRRHPVVQELLGHASLSTTQVYTKVSPERLRTAYEAAHPAPGAIAGAGRAVSAGAAESEAVTSPMVETRTWCCARSSSRSGTASSSSSRARWLRGRPQLRRELRRLEPGHRRAGRDRGAGRHAQRDAA